jgi:hypothetical protein
VLVGIEAICLGVKEYAQHGYCPIFIEKSTRLDFGYWRKLLSRLLAPILDSFLNGGILKPII